MKIFKKSIYILLFALGLFLSMGSGLVLFNLVRVPFGFIFNVSFYLFVGSMLFVFLLIAILCSRSSKRWVSIVGILSRVFVIIIAIITLLYSFDYDYRVLYFKHKYPDLIYTASAGGSIRTVESLLKNDFDLNKKDKDGWTLLHCAAAEGKIEMVKYLIDKGIDINDHNKQGETAYNLAVFFNLAETTEYLKEVGVDTSAPQFPGLFGPYMGQKPPGDKPELFLPGIVSGHYPAHTPIVFSPDGNEAYWCVGRPPDGIVLGMDMVGNQWTYPKLSKNMTGEPAFSPDGKKLYFISLKPLREGEQSGKENIWVMDKTAAGWSKPGPVGDAVNSMNLHWQPSVDNDYNLYFSDYGNIYYSQFKDGEYQKPVNIAELYNNETLRGFSPYISPDGNYLLFSANHNIHISFKKKDGSWTDRINLGNKINPGQENGTSRVTPDGKYIFFVSSSQEGHRSIYWVSSNILDKLKRQ